MDEKKLLDLLKDSASDLTPPESLSPESVEEKLLRMQKKQKSKKMFYFTRFAATAAAVVLCLTVVWQTNHLQKASREPETQSASDGIVTDSSVTSEASAGHAADTAPESPAAAAVQPAASYEEVYEALRERFYYEEDDFYPALGARSEIVYEEEALAPDEEMAVEDSVADTASNDSSLADSKDTGASADYSTTNIQEQGVDEADIVKTDGEYIYILRQNGAVTIVKADPQQPETISVISPADTSVTSVRELYLDGTVLSIIADRYDSSLKQDDDIYYTSGIEQTALYTYDISDPSAPQLTGTVIQDGYYQTSRKVDQYIYLFTSWYPELRATYEESDIIPKVNNSLLEASDFYLPEHPGSSAYLLISSVDIHDPQEILDKKALVSGVSNFYVSTKNIYIANEEYTGGTSITEITKFSYKDGIVTGLAADSVKGYLNDSFSMNEYQGYLRVVSTYYDDNWEEQNALYILDDSLHVTGRIENLAEGETIRSARFFGDTGYFVTFRQTDPLFSADLSDPANPVILGELKVSGFSSYLHFYGKDLLLGMGYEADETTGEIYGVKLSMFDISDPADVKELHRIVIPDVTWCPSLENYKSILIDPEKNLFGFFCGDRYLVFSYEKETGFTSELVYDLMGDAIVLQTGGSDLSTQENAETDTETDLTTSEVFEEDVLVDDISADYSPWSSGINSYNTRGLYINDAFYLAGDSSVIVFDMTDDFRKISALTLSK